ncbi:hypothetical protein CcI49_35800 [Frankia sp. CcI49]|uniref:hypothetical protein n=1 Tax=unclassified Frankia TaxID=2632575 RepID=UPI0006CA5EA1|nr:MULTISPECIES: hypothetical protein [unclassified Frankia]KPM53671.1 hypothetical protein ACG83_23955 [Frankia sp. R43]ONH49559.1 hypothetical protein CcI49_38595 [Frankia sp. CcI49]ONH51431.1 hypothetical protein CcI49_35800 [Frankia sp. CcI49]
MIDGDADGQRFLVLHDYGMSELWWWVRARSAQEIVERIAEVEVVTQPEAVQRAATWDLTEVALDAPHLPSPLKELRKQRDAQRGHPDFAACAGRALVHLCRRWEGEDGVDPASYYLEVGPDGRRLRQVEVRDDGTSVRSGPDDWAFNPPVVDLYAPEAAAWEINSEEFEAQWRRAVDDGA